MEPFSYQNFYQKFEPRLQLIVDCQIKRLQNLSQGEYFIAVLNHFKQLAKRGKRFRSYLVALAYQTAGGQDWTKTFQIGASLELVHLFALIHDDVIDADIERRGLDTLEKFSADWLSQNQRQGNLEVAAQSLAILWGDLVLAAAFNLAKTSRQHKELSVLVEELIVGQMMDVEFSTRKKCNVECLNRKNYLKTTLYSFVRPLQIGGELAQAEPRLQKQFSEVGYHLGSAFQIQDDLEDGAIFLPATAPQNMQKHLDWASSIIQDLPDQDHKGWQDLIQLIFPSQVAVG